MPVLGESSPNEKVPQCMGMAFLAPITFASFSPSSGVTWIGFIMSRDQESADRYNCMVDWGSRLATFISNTGLNPVSPENQILCNLFFIYPVIKKPIKMNKYGK